MSDRSACVQIAGHSLTFQVAGNGYRYRSAGGGALSGYVAACYSIADAVAIVRTRLEAFNNTRGQRCGS